MRMLGSWYCRGNLEVNCCCWFSFRFSPFLLEREGETLREMLGFFFPIREKMLGYFVELLKS